MDSQRGIFISFLETHHLTDIEPGKLVPTWHNLRIGKDVVSKIFDGFLAFEYLFSSILLVNALVVEGGISNNRPIVLKIKSEIGSTPSAFKFNHIWMKEEYFVSMVKRYWKPLDSSGH